MTAAQAVDAVTMRRAGHIHHGPDRSARVVIAEDRRMSVSCCRNSARRARSAGGGGGGGGADDRGREGLINAVGCDVVREVIGMCGRERLRVVDIGNGRNHDVVVKTNAIEDIE